MGHVLKYYSSPMVWKSIPEELQDSVNVAEYLKEKWCGSSERRKVLQCFWALATIY